MGRGLNGRTNLMHLSRALNSLSSLLTLILAIICRKAFSMIACVPFSCITHMIINMFPFVRVHPPPLPITSFGGPMISMVVVETEFTSSTH